MLLPHRNLLIVAGLWLASGVLAVWLPAALPIWQVGGGGLLAAMLADGWLARSIGNPLQVARQTAQIWPVGVEQTIRLRLSGSARAVHGQVYDRYPPLFAAASQPQSFRVEGGQWIEIAYHLTPTELARESGLERREVITKCMELGVPIFQGRIDTTLFLASLAATGPGSVAPRPS